MSCTQVVTIKCEVFQKFNMHLIAVHIAMCSPSFSYGTFKNNITIYVIVMKFYIVSFYSFVSGISEEKSLHPSVTFWEVSNVHERWNSISWLVRHAFKFNVPT